MQSALEIFLNTGLLAFMMTFARIGSALMIMPGLGDSFVSERVRLLMALGVSLVLTPFVAPFMPAVTPPMFALILMLGTEVIIGLLIGTVARIFMTALDTAGMVVSTQSGLANAQVFNPSLAAQGSIIGAFLSMTGVTIIFASNMHHLLITGLVESYTMFPIGEIPDTGSMAELVAKAVSASFNIGVKIAAPFLVVTLLIYVGMGVLSRLMPQVQVFLIILPLQILIAIILLSLTATALFAYWLSQFESGMIFFFSAASPP